MKVTSSRFNMIRAMAHMAHLDSQVSTEETKMIHGYLDRMAFTPEQKAVLHKELDAGSNIDEILANVTEPADRAQVVHFARVLCFCDGKLHPNEKEILDRIHSHVMGKADVSQAARDAGAAAILSMETVRDRPKFYLEKFFDWIMSH